MALQMIKSGDWLHPRVHPEHAHWTKPPLTYWAIAASLLTFGINEFAVRFTNAFSFLLTIVISFYLGKVMTPRKPWLVALVFATFLFPATMCNGATTDFPVMMWETLAVCFFVHAFWGSANRKFILSMLMWAVFGLAFLTKGPPGILPLLSIIIFLQLKCAKQRSFQMPWLRGLFLMGLIGASWYLLVILENPSLAGYFLWDEIVLRLFTDHHQRHGQWYAFLYIYFPVLIFGSLPWIVFAARGLIGLFKSAQKALKADINDNNVLNVFLILWFVVPLAIFILSKSNLPLYILPLFVPLAIITAREIDRRNVSLYSLRYWIALWGIIIVLIRPLMATLHFGKDSRKFARAIKQYHPQPVEEIVFANTRRAFGLQFYTGTDIDRVSFDFDAMESELKEEGVRIWVVDQQESEQFRRELIRHKVEMRELGPVAAWKNYVLFLENSDKIYFSGDIL